MMSIRIRTAARSSMAAIGLALASAGVHAAADDLDRQVALRAPAFAAAAQAGNVDAVMRLATWHMIGAPLPRDLPRARALLRRAVEIGHVDGALMEVALTANGSGGPVDWPGALRLISMSDWMRTCM